MQESTNEVNNDPLSCLHNKKVKEPTNNSSQFFHCFDTFHKDFLGDVVSLNCGNLCSECKNNCELDLKNSDVAVAYLPHEIEYIAHKCSMSADEFRNRNAFGVDFGDFIIDILKYKIYCNFLNSDYSCALKEYKLSLCKIFPLIHHPDIGLLFHEECNLSSSPTIMMHFYNNMNHYWKLCSDLKLSAELIHALEFIGTSKIMNEDAKELMQSDTYTVIKINDFKKYLQIGKMRIKCDQKSKNVIGA